MLRVFMVVLLGGMACAHAQTLDKVRFGTNWLADPEHGGYYQALADGTYEQIRPRRHDRSGRPECQQRHAAARRQDRILHGRANRAISLRVEHNIPTIAVAASFQKDPQIFMSHPGVGHDNWRI